MGRIVSGNFRGDPEASEDDVQGEPGWLTGPAGPIFSWYHPPKGPARQHAVLFCEPFGPDRMNLHLTYRALAQRFAAAGFAVLRFDYSGTGDSSGSPRDAGWPAGWLADARVAAAHLFERSGSGTLAVFGARVGGTLATALACTCEDVTSLLLWGPYLDGDAFLRSERTLARFIAGNESAGRAGRAQLGDEELLGFVYSASALDYLNSLRPIESEHFFCRRVKLVAWSEDSPEGALAAHLGQLGIRVDFDRPEGYCSDDSIMHQAVPDPLLNDIVSWLVGVEAESSSTGRGRPVAPHGLASTSVSDVQNVALVARADVRRSDARAGVVEEEAIHFGGDGALFGILSGAVSSSRVGSRLGLLLVNGGNNHRVGINRNYTEWAREAALSGVTTLRFDIRGLGDSRPRHPEDLNRLYRDETREDVIAAIDLLADRDDCDGVVLCGLCAGAYQAFHAARVDPRVVGLVLLDLLRWDPDGPLIRRRGFWTRRRQNLERWARAVRSFSGLGAWSEPTLLARGLCEMTDRGVEILAVSSVGEGFESVSAALDSDRQRLEASGRFRLEPVADAGHIFAPIWSQEWLSGRLSAFLATARSDPSGSGGAAQRTR